MSVRLAPLTAAAATTLTILTGCGLGKSCTLIGAESGVNFDLVDAVPASLTTFEVHACVDTALTSPVVGMNRFASSCRFTPSPPNEWPVHGSRRGRTGAS
jgi:hypothetical protein